MDIAKFRTLGAQHGPNALHHSVLAPALAPAVDGRVVAELRGQVIPLTAAAQAVDDAVEDRTPILGGLASFRAGLPIVLEDGLDACPKFIADFPDGSQGLRLGARPWHGRIPP
jgi:hypothetical protein